MLNYYEQQILFLGAKINGGTDELRKLICTSPSWIYRYASEVDKTPLDLTRKAVCEDPRYAYLYARELDKIAREDTRASACEVPEFGYLYAFYVDKCPHKDTRASACASAEYAYRYALKVDCELREDTYQAVLNTKFQKLYEDDLEIYLKQDSIKKSIKSFREKWEKKIKIFF